jgi:hypothetical protein
MIIKCTQDIYDDASSQIPQQLGFKVKDKSEKEKSEAYRKSTSTGDRSFMYLPLCRQIEEPILTDFY